MFEIASKAYAWNCEQSIYAWNCEPRGEFHTSKETHMIHVDFPSKINKTLFWTDMPWLQMTPKKSVWPIFCIVLVQFFIVQELFHSKINLVIGGIFISLQNLTRKKASNGPLMCSTSNPLSFSRNLSWNPPMQLHSQQPGFKKFSNCFKS